MRFLRQSLIGLVLTALTLGLLAYAGSLVRDAVQERMADDRRAPPARERVFAVGVITAQVGTETPVLETFGEVQSRRTLELRATTSGRVVWLAEGFEDGGLVSEGDVLMRIDPADAEAAVERAAVDLQDAEAELADAERSLLLARDETAAAVEQAELREKAFQRQVDLAGRGVGTAAAVETAELNAAAARQQVLSRRQAVAQAEKRLDQARTQVARSKIAVAEMQRDLDDTTVIAPFSGTLKETNVVEGRLVSANEQFAQLIDAKTLEASFRVSTAQFARLLDPSGALTKAPVRATLDVAGVDLQTEGMITRASAESSTGQTGRLVFARLDAPRGFRPGDFVTVAVSEPPLDNVVRLPASAYDADGAVLAVTDEDRLERLEVRLIRRQGDDVLVRGRGLAGREVVEAISPLLGAGIQVRPIRRGAAPEAPAMVQLTDERRAKLVAFVQANNRMPADVKERILTRLSEPKVPAQMIQRLESRMGG